MGIIMKKLISSLLILTMLLTSFTLVFADANTVTFSIADDSYIKLGETITATFGTAITEAVAKAGITVTKIGDETNTNLVESVSVNGTAVTLNFGDNLEYSSHYKLTVAESTGVAGDDKGIYFSTYNKMFRGINTLFVEENFNTTAVDTLPANGAYNNTNIGSYKETAKTDSSKLTVGQVANAFVSDNKALHLVGSRSDAGYDQQVVHFENYNARVRKSPSERVVISFKYKAPGSRLADMRLKVTYYNKDADGNNILNANGQKTTSTKEVAVFGYKTSQVYINFFQGEGTDNRVTGGFPTATVSDWHEFTAEYDTSDSENLKCVYVAIDGEPVKATQNYPVTLNSFNKVSELQAISLYLNEWTSGSVSEVFIDDVKLYCPDAYVATTATSEVVAGSVSEESAKVKVSFTNPVDKATLATIGVTPAGGDKILAAATVVSNDLKTATLTFNGLTAGTEYTVNVPAEVKDVFANSVTGTDVKFTTTAIEGVEVSAPVISGTSTPGSEVSASASYAANETGKPVNVTLMLALYEGIQLVRFAPATETLAANAPAGTITANLTVPSKEKHGIYSAKAFVWDSVTGMNNLVSSK